MPHQTAQEERQTRLEEASKRYDAQVQFCKDQMEQFLKGNCDGGSFRKLANSLNHADELWARFAQLVGRN